MDIALKNLGAIDCDVAFITTDYTNSDCDFPDPSHVGSLLTYALTRTNSIPFTTADSRGYRGHVPNGWSRGFAFRGSDACHRRSRSGLQQPGGFQSLWILAPASPRPRYMSPRGRGNESANSGTQLLGQRMAESLSSGGDSLHLRRDAGRVN